MGEKLESLVSWYDSFTFNFPLVILVVLMAIWLANLIPSIKLWDFLMPILAELMGGILFGLLIGYSLTFHRYSGVLTLGSLVAAIVLILNAENKLLRIIGCSVAIITAAIIYLLVWGDFYYLRESIIEDFT